MVSQIKPEVLYEDSDILAVNKPAGIIVHSDGRSDEKTLSDWFVFKYPESSDVGEPIELFTGAIIKKPGVVHRIDKETSGVILLAKTEKGFLCLKNQFKNREVEKKYKAFVWSRFNEDKMEGEINKPIGRSASDFRRRSAGRGARGKMREALTEYRVLGQNEEFAYVEAIPKTGRTHQIRAHMVSISHPIVCDSLYAPTKPKGLSFTRLALHAEQIKFRNAKKEEVLVEAPLPEDFKRALKALAID